MHLYCKVKKLLLCSKSCIAPNFGLIVGRISNIYAFDRDLFVILGAGGIMHRPYLAVPEASIRPIRNPMARKAYRVHIFRCLESERGGKEGAGKG